MAKKDAKRAFSLNNDKKVSQSAKIKQIRVMVDEQQKIPSYRIRAQKIIKVLN